MLRFSNQCTLSWYTAVPMDTLTLRLTTLRHNQDTGNGVCVLSLDCISSKHTIKEIFRQLSANVYKVFVCTQQNIGIFNSALNFWPLEQFTRITLLVVYPTTTDFASYSRHPANMDNVYALYQSLVRCNLSYTSLLVWLTLTISEPQQSFPTQTCLRFG